MTCHCGKVALYRVGAAGFCKDHRVQAKAESIVAGARHGAMMSAASGHDGNRPKCVCNLTLKHGKLTKGGYRRFASR